MLRLVIRVQGIFYVLTGAWPLLSLETFELVTGPKIDDWLVHMVGLLATVIGMTLWVGTRLTQPAGTLVLLAAGTAVSFMAIDLRYALTGRISAVYLLDAAVEFCFLLVLLVSWLRVQRAA